QEGHRRSLLGQKLRNFLLCDFVSRSSWRKLFGSRRDRPLKKIELRVFESRVHQLLRFVVVLRANRDLELYPILKTVRCLVAQDENQNEKWSIVVDATALHCERNLSLVIGRKYCQRH